MVGILLSTSFHAGTDPITISLWLGHESPRSTQPYIHADLKIKEQALARTTPPDTKPGRYRPPDKLLAFLESLGLCRCGNHGLPCATGVTCASPA